MPHILNARRFGIETVIITARSDAAAAVKEAAGLLLWLEIKIRINRTGIPSECPTGSLYLTLTAQPQRSGIGSI